MNIITENIAAKETGESKRSAQLINYTLHLADNTLILGHRNSEWCGHGPILELDIAITNIALDLIGQARHFYQYAAELLNQSKECEHANLIGPGIINQQEKTNRKASPKGGGLEVAASEDTLAYHRNAPDFKNCLLVEQPNGDWGVTMIRQFFFSTYQYFLYQQLQHSGDTTIAAIATKALKEVTYHVRWSSEWVIRLGKGTEESHRRMAAAVDALTQYTPELFTPVEYEAHAAAEGFGADVSAIKPLWLQKVSEVFSDATLQFTMPASEDGLFGKDGNHTPHLENLLKEMQFLQRAHPGAEW